MLAFLSADAAAIEHDRAVLAHVGECERCRDWLVAMATIATTTEGRGITSAVEPSGEPAVSPFESRFQFGNLIGQGGMGAVWEATDLSTGEAVAIKVIETHDPVLRRRAIREGKIRKRVTHPHLLVAHDQFETLRGDIALVMARLFGETLADRLTREGPLSWNDARVVLLPIAAALMAVHAAGLVHRDVKPQNIFLEAASPRKSWLLDFGMAKVLRDLSLSSTGGQLTAENAVLGTPHYMAPEQLYGEPDVGPAADVWAFGVVLFEALSGERAAPGKSFGQVFQAVTTGKLRSLREVAPHVPEAAAILVDGLLVREPAMRPPMVEVELALRK